MRAYTRLLQIPSPLLPRLRPRRYRSVHAAGHDLARQERFYVAQLALARRFGLPVVLHVRRSADRLLKHLRPWGGAGGIVHAFNGSEQQALAFVDLGFKLGFGGAMTFERALRIRRLARRVPETAVVLETDAPDIPPQWRYRTADERAAGVTMRNEPGELPRIARTLADLDAQFAPMARLIDESLIALREGVEAVERYESGLDADPGRQEWVAQRLASIEALARKHRVEPDQLTGTLAGFIAELEQLETLEASLESIEASLRESLASFQAACIVSMKLRSTFSKMSS